MKCLGLGSLLKRLKPAPIDRFCVSRAAPSAIALCCSFTAFPSRQLATMAAEPTLASAVPAGSGASAVPGSWPTVAGSAAAGDAAAAPAVAYRLMLLSELDALKASGSFAGSGIDVRDGFIHMSPAESVRDSANLYFKGKEDAMLLRVDLAALPADKVKWDWAESRKAFFPHLYEVPLPWSAVASAFGPLAIGADGKFELPAEIP